MPVRSINDRRYSRRFLIMGIAICAFGLWALYDGFVKYPDQRERALLFQQLDEGEIEGKTAADWDEEASKRGWSTEYPGEPKSEVDIKLQYAMAALCGAIGLPMLLLVFMSRGNWVESTESGITSSWGQSFDFDQIVSVDKRKWPKKGIAKVTYEEGGRRRRFVLDDFKFERPTMDQILYELEQHIDPNKITGGPPELPPDHGVVEDEVFQDAAQPSEPRG